MGGRLPANILGSPGSHVPLIRPFPAGGRAFWQVAGRHGLPRPSGVTCRVPIPLAGNSGCPVPRLTLGPWRTKLAFRSLHCLPGVVGAGGFIL